MPQQSAYVVERLGKYRATLHAGFHLLLPFLDAIRYRHSLKETADDIPEQICDGHDRHQPGGGTPGPLRPAPAVVTALPRHRVADDGDNASPAALLPAVRGPS